MSKWITVRITKQNHDEVKKIVSDPESLFSNVSQFVSFVLIRELESRRKKNV